MVTVTVKETEMVMQLAAPRSAQSHQKAKLATKKHKKHKTK
jgi:hypothetical protein